MGLLIGAATPAAHAANLDQVAQQVASDLDQAKQEKRQTDAQIAASRKALTAQLAQLQAQVDAARADVASAQSQLDGLRRQRDKLQTLQVEHGSQMQALKSAIAQTGQKMLERVKHSPFTAETPARIDTLKNLLAGKQTPNLTDIDKYVEIAFDDMHASRQIMHRQGMFINRQGNQIEGQIFRFGHIDAIYQQGQSVGYLNPSPASGRLMAAAPPPWQIGRNLKAYVNGQTDAVYVDISGGAAIAQLARRISWWKQIKTGGVLVWPIVLVGAVALLLMTERLIFLGRVRQNTDRLMTQVTELVLTGDFDQALQAAQSQAGRPTSNVIQAGLSQQGQPRDIIESSLSEAILKETPRLERFLPTLKVLAAVAPLLGLLGTVTGMINTFKVITIHGAGDPRLMAGGISEALITTQLGLAVAIPIMIIATLLGRKAQRIAADMEEKAMAMMAALLKRRSIVI